MISKRVVFYISIAVMGSFLFGFNTAVISGALLYISDQFELHFFKQAILVSSILIGALFGSVLGGSLSDSIGRKKTFFLTSFIFFVGTFFVSSFASYNLILLGRIVQGLAVGIVSMLVPLYLSEISPTEKRGQIVSLNQLFIVLGVFSSYIVNYFISDWQMMFRISFIPNIILFLGLFFLPETSSFLNRKREGISKNSDGRAKLFKKEHKKPFVIGIGISVIQQVTGINIILYYAPKIFQQSHSMDHESAIFQSIFIGFFMLVATILSLFFVDRMGRRKLLLTSSFGMVVSLLFLAFFQGRASFFAIAYVIFFAIGLGPVTWLLISEIFPVSIRGRAVGVATLSNWASNYMVAILFLPLFNLFGSKNTFLLIAIITSLSYIFIKKMVPETKNKTFLEIENSLNKIS